MAIKHLGQFGPPRKSEIGEAIDAYTKSRDRRRELADERTFKSRENQLDRRSKERIAQANRATTSASALASNSIEEKKLEQKAVDGLHQMLSEKHAAMTPEHWETFMKTPEYKELGKRIKKQYPELVNDKGEIILKSGEEIVKLQLEAQKARILQDVYEGKHLGKSQIGFMNMIRNYDIDLVSNVMVAASKSLLWPVLNKEERAEYIRGLIEQAHAAQEEQYSMLAGDFTMEEAPRVSGALRRGPEAYADAMKDAERKARGNALLRNFRENIDPMNILRGQE
jgi:hypothetical protein